MALFLLITYIVILIFQIILFVISIRKKTKKLWRILFSAELVPLLISIGLMIYYNNLPGYGFMPGLTYLGEVLFSFGAVVLYCISFLISICSYIAISNKQTQFEVFHLGVYLSSLNELKYNVKILKKLACS